jgi:hypothetical protein
LQGQHIFLPDNRPTRNDEKSLHKILEFADIARPVIVCQGLDGLFCK